VQPGVDAPDVEQVPALGQAPHHLAAAHVLQAHGARHFAAAAVCVDAGSAFSSMAVPVSHRARAPPPGPDGNAEAPDGAEE
jgi:hypothetical protein